MTSSSQRILAAVAAVGLGLGGLAVTAQPAAADVPCVINGFTPTDVIVGLAPKVATFAPKVTGCSTLEDWTLAGDTFTLFKGLDQQVFDPFDNSEVKAQDVVVTAANTEFQNVTNKVFPDAFRLKRASTWDQMNASPEPVTKGRPISIKARLRIADWTNDRYVDYANRTVDLQFRTLTGKYTRVKSITTGSTGYATTSVTATSDGCFRLVWGGNSAAGRATGPGDCVDVR
jgi:hypothetical protein